VTITSTKYQLTAYERESIIILNDDEQYATVYSCQRPMINKLDKLCKTNPDTYKFVKSDEYSKTYHIDKKLISFRTPVQRKEISEEQRKVLSDRMKTLRTKTLVENE
jgi:hypothetical protein